MIVVYADGGGLGHLTRVRALRHSLGLDDEITVLSASPHAEDRRVTDGLRVVPIPHRRRDLAARRSWLRRALDELAPAAFVVDAFPAGLAGEIDASTVAPSIVTTHLARLLHWPAYRRVLPDRPLRFQQVHVLEALHPDHRAYLDAHAARLDPLVLHDPPVADGTESPWAALAGCDLRLAGTRHPRHLRWLVAHTGPGPEVDELVAYAREQAVVEELEPLLVVASAPGAAPPPAEDLVVIDRYPVWPLFAEADRVITAAGFNTMRQLAPHRDRHRFVAMPRRFDDQVERARRARREVVHAATVDPGAAP